MKIAIAMLLLTIATSYAQKPLQEPSNPPVKLTTYEGQMLKSKRCFTWGVISMATGGVIALLGPKLLYSFAETKDLHLVGAGLGVIGLGLIIQSNIYSNSANTLKKKQRINP